MSLPQAETREESYFVAQLAAEAKRHDVAAPATIDSLIANLTYLSDEEINLVRDAHATQVKLIRASTGEPGTTTSRTPPLLPRF